MLVLIPTGSSLRELAYVYPRRLRLSWCGLRLSYNVSAILLIFVECRRPAPLSMKENIAFFTGVIRRALEQQCLREMEEEFTKSSSHDTRRIFTTRRPWLKWLSVLTIYMLTVICVDADRHKMIEGMVCCCFFWFRLSFTVI